MAGGVPAAGAAGNGVKIVVAGDAKTGKSSLIVTAAAENFPTNVPPVLPPTRLPVDLYPERVPVTIVDTSSRYWAFLLVCCVHGVLIGVSCKISNCIGLNYGILILLLHIYFLCYLMLQLVEFGIA